ncbi:DUF881 domain-containing protein [Candidatus Oleimmundimicrobium sp.]|uniref:DUF881 domain-containing protein n=1 Tax=Candidatus Oleimmundimicrobium sp. TaxID=3060597 RepID=UPI0027196350|nr:DUF881 domain-containing protein [Candidatus Oleimmundimicrobium sp.]MDO8885316.1 DUF881 domain-containing protein [Candidatus Oleimmundimicrobium sp.]
MKDIFHVYNVYDRLQTKRMQVAIAVIFAIIGMLLVTQLQIQSGISKKLQQESKQDLGEIIRDLDIEVRALQEERRDLEIRLVKYQNATEDQQLILNEAAHNLENLKIFAGLIGVKGEGVEVVIEDKQQFLDCYDLIDVVNELKAGGAEVLSINGIRITANTSFANESGGQIVIDKKKVSPSFIIKAIGNSETLSQAVGLLGGIQYTLTSYEGVTFEVARMESLEIPPTDFN